jgi:hypothetical protein
MNAGVVGFQFETDFWVRSSEWKWRVSLDRLLRQRDFMAAEKNLFQLLGALLSFTPAWMMPFCQNLQVQGPV